ncbi:MAG: protein kinase [bacterium]
MFRILRASLRRCREAPLRRKLELFLQVAEGKGVAAAAQGFGKTSRYYYFWWNRYRDSGFRWEALRERSRRPKRPARRTETKVVRWICQYREKFRYSLHEIQRALLRERRTRVSIATIYRVLVREKVKVRKRRGGSRAKERVESSAEPVPPTIVDRYRIERNLGAGAGGTVYLARDPSLPDAPPVALKIVAAEAETDLSATRALLHEFRALSALRHRHLAQVYDLGCEGKLWYLSSEYVEGVDILQACRGANLNTIFQLVVQILRALDYLHCKGVLHLDLKPSNILVTDPDACGELSVKLIDFGSATLRQRGVDTKGEFVGTLPYASPEMILEQTPSPASDLYSLGILLHQIFAQRLPFASTDSVALMQEQLYGQPLRMERLAPALPEGFADFLLKTVATDPKRRFQSAREVLAALSERLGENFSLRESETRGALLEESSYLFRQSRFDELCEMLLSRRPQVIVLSGASGFGKSRWLRELKARLQLRGQRPSEWGRASDLTMALQRGELSGGEAVLLDDSTLDPARLSELIDELENLRVPALIATRLPAALELNPTRWINLEPLTAQDLAGFFQSELHQFPFAAGLDSVQGWIQGMPSALEQVLRAFQEAGLMQWSDEGWTWTGEEPWDLPRIMAEREARWEERRLRVLEILGLTKVGLGSAALEGMLGLEAGALEGRLQDWERQGVVAAKRHRGAVLYSIKKREKTSVQLAPTRDWRRVEAELRRLYDQGNFAAGVAWAEQLRAMLPETNALPVGTRLLCARHHAAAGHAEEAEACLPSDAPRSTRDRGLYWEIRGRIGMLRGNSAAALSALVAGEEVYRAAQDFMGISRVFNLRGSIQKRAGELDAALVSFTMAIEAGETAGDSLHRGFAAMNLANLYFDQGRWEDAEAWYQRALALSEAAAHPAFACKLRENYLNFLYQQGRLAEAEAAAYPLLHLAIRHHYPEQQAIALNFLALLAGQKNHRELQRQYLGQALSILNERRSPQAYFQTLMNRAQLYWTWEKFTAAQLDAEHAFSLAERAGNPAFLAWSCLWLGKIHRDRPKADLAEASRYLNQAHQRILKNQIHSLLWEVEYDRGLLAKKRGQKDRAKNYFLAANRYLDSLLLEMPEPARLSFLRDNKREKVLVEINGLE